jgi:hypothetical protein
VIDYQQITGDSGSGARSALTVSFPIFVDAAPARPLVTRY